MPSSEFSLPNISISNLTVYLEDDVPAFFLLYFRKDAKETFNRKIGYISNISVSGVKYVYQKKRTPCSLCISNHELNIDTPVNCSLTDIDLIGNSTGRKRPYGSLINNLKFRSSSSKVLQERVKAEK